MKILVACEESQAVTKAFRRRGHEAYSADIQDCSGGHEEWHIKGDVLPLLKEHWDMIIAFPPCTFISNAGACRLYPEKGVLNEERYQKGLQAKSFFMEFYNCDCERVAIENPVPSTIYKLPKRTQIIQPYEHGHPYSKKTYLWLKGLPPLEPTKILTQYQPFVASGTSRKDPTKYGASRAGGASKARSKTFDGIAEAMASQWGCSSLKPFSEQLSFL